MAVYAHKKKKPQESLLPNSILAFMIYESLVNLSMFCLLWEIKLPQTSLGKQAEATLMMDRNHKAICMKIKSSPV